MSEHVRRGACASTGKRCFTTRDAAKHNLRVTNLKLAVYKCYECGYFHQGGWQGNKDRAAHRGEMPTDTITPYEAAHALNVSPSFITRLVESGKIRSENGMPNRLDIDRLTKVADESRQP